jgi:threonine dehydrogenase-like Zn-dependent dehydrogenase
VGLFAIQSAFLLGAGRVVAIDTVAERLSLARQFGAETIDFEDGNVHEQILGLTKGLGPDAVIDAVGMESHGAEGTIQKITSAVQSTVTAMDRPYAINAAIKACRPGGTVSMPGVYMGANVPSSLGPLMNKGLTLKTGQTHVHKYMPRLMQLIEEGKIDPAAIITHTSADLDEGPALYDKFRDKEDGCVKVVLFPHGDTANRALAP